MTLVYVFVALALGASLFGAGVWFGAKHSNPLPSPPKRTVPPGARVEAARADKEVAEELAEMRRIELQAQADELQAGMRLEALRDGAVRQQLELTSTLATPDEVGSLLRAARKQQALRQEDVSRRTGIKTDRLSEIELGRRPPTGEELERLAKSLSVDFVPATIRFKAPKVKHTLALAAASVDDD